MLEKLLEKTLYGVSKPVVQTYTSTMLDMDIHKKSPFPCRRQDHCAQPSQHH